MKLGLIEITSRRPEMTDGGGRGRVHPLDNLGQPVPSHLIAVRMEVSRATGPARGKCAGRAIGSALNLRNRDIALR